MGILRAQVAAAFITAAGFFTPAYSFDVESRRAGESCSTNSDCAGALACEAGACRARADAAQSGAFLSGPEEAFQTGADVRRLNHLKYYADLLAEFRAKTGRYPLQDKASEIPVYVFVAHDGQRATGAPPYKHMIVSMRDWVRELESGLGRTVDEYYDPQYASEGHGRPNLYLYMVYKDTYFFAVHLYHEYPFAKKVAEHYNKLEISNNPNSQNRASDPRQLVASAAFLDALNAHYDKAEFFKARDARYLHYTK